MDVPNDVAVADAGNVPPCRRNASIDLDDSSPIRASSNIVINFVSPVGSLW